MSRLAFADLLLRDGAALVIVKATVVLALASAAAAAAKGFSAARRHTLSARSIPLPSHPLVALWIIGCAALLVRHDSHVVHLSRTMTRPCGSSPPQPRLPA